MSLTRRTLLAAPSLLLVRSGAAQGGLAGAPGSSHFQFAAGRSLRHPVADDRA